MDKGGRYTVKKIDWSRFQPPGRGRGQGLVGATVMAVLATGKALIQGGYAIFLSWESLYIQGRPELGLRLGAKMPRFSVLVEGVFSFYPLVALFLIWEVVSRYRYYVVESKSIYLMARLPDRWEIHRRSWVLPLGFALATVGLTVMVWLALLGVYHLVTPAGCLPR